jgi:hypothetical protein
MFCSSFIYIFFTFFMLPQCSASLGRSNAPFPC